MSVLKMIERPMVKFDPSNPDHRKWLGEFTNTLSWGNCPVRFSNEGYGNTVAQMQQRLIQYYISQEFDK
jgi:hypothetical protein